MVEVAKGTLEAGTEGAGIEAAGDEETGQTVVKTGISTVVTELYGQLVTVDAHAEIVERLVE